MLKHQVEQRRHVFVRALRVLRHPGLLRGAVEDRKIELLLIRVEIGEQIEDLVQHLDMALVRPVDLVDRHDGLEPELQRLGNHELGLRHRPFGSVDQHDHAVNHIEDALHLAAEIGVARRIDDVDTRVFPVERRHLGEDGDAALALQVVRIHGAFGDALVVAERARLFQKHVDEGGFAVIDVGNDGYVAQVHG